MLQPGLLTYVTPSFSFTVPLKSGLSYRHNRSVDRKVLSISTGRTQKGRRCLIHPAPVMSATAEPNYAASIADVAMNVPPNAGYSLRETPGRGEGVFATKDFKEGETVMKGFILGEVPGNHSHATQVALNRWVQHGGLNSKVNHSCNPNCGVSLNEQGAYDFVARKDIACEEEISFDYAMRNYVIEHFPKRCICGAPDCRETITGYKDLPDVFKDRYKGFIAPYLLELDEKSKAGLE